MKLQLKYDENKLLDLMIKNAVACTSLADDIQKEIREAYYADDWQVVLDFCQTYQVDYLAVDLETYSAEFLAKEKIFFDYRIQSFSCAFCRFIF